MKKVPSSFHPSQPESPEGTRCLGLAKVQIGVTPPRLQVGRWIWRGSWRPGEAPPLMDQGQETGQRCRVHHGWHCDVLSCPHCRHSQSDGHQRGQQWHDTYM